MRSDGNATRSKLLDSALQLWAEKGVEGTSLGDIRKAAGQRNESALHYYFGSGDGLLAAVFERHVPSIRHRREELLGLALESPEVRPVAEALVLPVAELVLGDWRDQAFARVAARALTGTNRGELDGLIGDSAVRPATVAFLERVAWLPERVAKLRLQVAGNMVVHATADYAERTATKGRRTAAPGLWIANIVDMWIAATTAPVSNVAMTHLSDPA